MFARRLCGRKSAFVAILCAAAPAAAEARSVSGWMTVEATVVHSLDAEQQDGALTVRTEGSALLVPDEGVSVAGENGAWTATATDPAEPRYLTIVYF